jgi:hypothetical protein
MLVIGGLVESLKVQQHSSWKFLGMVRAVILMTVMILLGGLIGRNIYSGVPPTVM